MIKPTPVCKVFSLCCVNRDYTSVGLILCCVRLKAVSKLDNTRRKEIKVWWKAKCDNLVYLSYGFMSFQAWIHSIYSGSNIPRPRTVEVVGLQRRSLIFCQKCKSWWPIRPGLDRQTDVHTDMHTSDEPPHASKWLWGTRFAKLSDIFCIAVKHWW